MADEKRDSWAKFDIVIKAVAGILLPVIIFAVGAWYTSVQRNAADARLLHEKEAEIDQHNADVAAGLIKNLFSNNQGEKLFAVNLIQHLKGGQLTEEVKSAVVTVALTADDPKVANSASVAVSNAVKTDPKLIQTIQRVAQSSPGSIASKNPQLNEALANIAVNGQGEDKKAAADTLRVLSISPNRTVRDLEANKDFQDRRSEGSLRALNNNPLSLRGHDKEVIKVDINTKGTELLVHGSLNGKAIQGNSFSFTLDKSQSNPTVLVLLLTFSNETGGEYKITVRDANSSGEVSIYTVRQAISFRSAGVSYTFDIS